MKKLVIAIVATASLALGACSVNNQDTVDNAALNQPAADDLNAMSMDASNDAAAAEAEALGTQAQQLEQAPPVANTTTNASPPTDADEQNVSGM